MDFGMDSSLTSFRTPYHDQPESNSSIPLECHPSYSGRYIQYGDAPSTNNIAIHSHSMGLESSVPQYGQRIHNYGPHSNQSMSSEHYVHPQQPSDATEGLTESNFPSSEHFSLQRTQPQSSTHDRVVNNYGMYGQQRQIGIPMPTESLPNLSAENGSLPSHNPHIQQISSIRERLSLQSTQPQNSTHDRVVSNHGAYGQQRQTGIPLPTESLSNLPAENGSLPSYNPHTNQISSIRERLSLQSIQPQNSTHDRVMSSYGAYGQQRQTGIPLPTESLPNLPAENGSLPSHNPHIQQNHSQHHSHNHRTALGEMRHHQNHYPSSNIGVTQQWSTEEQAAKVIFPNRSVVIGEVGENLPVDAQRQDSLTRELTSVHQQTTSLGHSNAPTNGGLGVNDYSLMTERNRKLNEQHLHNYAVAPAVRPVPAHVSLQRDQGEKGTPGGQGHQSQHNSSSQMNTGSQHAAPQSQPMTTPYHHPPPPDRLPSAPGRLPSSAPGQYQMPLPNQNNPRVENRSSVHHSTQRQNGDDYIGKKVFILHFGPTAETIDSNPILKLGVTLTRMKVDVTLDLFEYDNPPNSWPLWYEQKIKDSDVVLCIITENFYQQLINNHVLGNSVYNLMNSSSSRSIAFRAVFIDAPRKEMEYIPPAMRGATCYSLSSNNLTPNDEEFANLYAFLTGQNRVEKPKLGNRIILPPKRSRFSHLSGGATPTYNGNMYQQQPQHQQPLQYQRQGMMYQPAPPQPPPPAAAVNPPAGEMPDVEQANFIFTLLGGDPTPVKSIRSHNKMFMQLASKLTAEWEGLGRLLNVSEPDVYAIKVDNIHSVTEQAVQMFRQWLMKNGSQATLGVLTTAVYDSGPQYWNLLDTINKYAPQQ